MDIIQRIHSAYPEMTKNRKCLQTACWSHLEVLHIFTLAQLSQKTSSSELTLLLLLSEGGLLQFFGDEECLP